MEQSEQQRCTAFAGSRCIATGELKDVALRVKAALEAGEQEPVLIFDDASSQLVEVDFRGTSAEVAGRLTVVEERRRPGRPKLGVVAREVTLMPRHWEWLNGQPGGASVALRKLVEQARRVNEGADRARAAQESAYRFMTAMAGNECGYEGAIRALFARDQARLESMTESWPEGVRSHALKLAARALEDQA